MLGVTGEGFESVMRGVAAILWPLTVVAIVALFRAEISDLLRRLRKGKVLGQEIELDRSIAELERGAEELASRPLPPIAASDPAKARPVGETPSGIERDTAEILEMAGTSPKAALMQLSATIEREARRLLAATGHADEIPRAASLRAMVEALERATSLQRGTLDVVRNFAEVRNRIIHGHQDVSNDEVLRAIDAGLIILKSLAAVPRERNVVYREWVTVYSDKDCTKEISDCHGVMLEATSAGGVMKSLRLYPTTRSHFRAGLEVAWEWNYGKKWGPAWYRHPDNGAVQPAWEGALEFVGSASRRNLDANPVY